MKNSEYCYQEMLTAQKKAAELEVLVWKYKHHLRVANRTIEKMSRRLKLAKWRKGGTVDERIQKLIDAGTSGNGRREKYSSPPPYPCEKREPTTTSDSEPKLRTPGGHYLLV